MKSDHYFSASEVQRAALTEKKKELIKELKIGEKSGLNENFVKEAFIKKVHSKYLNNEF